MCHSRENMCFGCHIVQFGDVQVSSVRRLHDGAGWGGTPSREFEMRLCSSMAHSLRESGRCNQIPLLLFHVVQEGVGFNILQTLSYYLKLPPLHIIPCWPDCLTCSRPEWPTLCGRVWGCCKYGLCASYQPCSHESNSNCLQMG
jgi:hypothetical protein